ncbi:SusC/RagA family TonB-linked outer membrane protein [Membranihabitans maritimus]|uniref:SusC/RagA family TonB-linked outer membrane protein n=1 Tax=Membranihabitans maritimus TaxID=2904244 RepID=UPI001F3B8C2A|nr:TonB-dependent receptor [Membranihabitans maritimus]
MMKKLEKLHSKIIILSMIVFSASICNKITAQETQIISGTILDSISQITLPGVNIMIKNTNQGTISDENGEFELNASPQDVLIFSYIGYETKEVAIGSNTTIEVLLQTEAHALDELVVTGYTTERKKDITGSVSVVDMESAKALPTGATMQALQGQASGVTIIASGVPGRAGNVNIRGISSFGNSSPLVLIDGVEANLNDINPNDISSIQILKDAGAASIYGVRGANGVIIVTTKKGASGAPVVSYDAYVGVQTPLSGNPFNILLDVEEYARLSLIADSNNPLFSNGIPDYMYAGPDGKGIANEGDPAIDPELYNFDPFNPSTNYLIQKTNKEGTNWFQELFNPAFRTNHNLSIRGGTETSNYFVSMGYLDQQGTVTETYIKRYSGRVNTSFDIGKHITIGQNLNLYYKQNPGFTTGNQFGSIAETARIMPMIPAYDIMGNYGGTRSGVNVGTATNPVANQERTTQNQGNSWNIVGNLFLDLNLLKNLKARTSLGGVLTNGYSYSFSDTPYERAEGFASPNSYSESSSFSRRLVWTNTLSFNEKFGLHSISALAGTEAIESVSRGLSGSRQNYFTNDPDYLLLSTGTTNISNGSSSSEDALWSVFSKLDYGYNDKYLLGGTIRRDGSSRFGPENRYGIFYSFSLGWRLSQEAFMKSVSWLNDLKVRGSYGEMGSQNNVNAVNQFDLYGGGLGTTYYDIKGTGNSIVQGFTQTRSGNVFTGWERNLVTNIGIDGSIFNYRIDFSLEYYKKSIDGLLFSQPLPAIAGGATPATVNIGDIQNKGVDISLKYNSPSGKDFTYSVGLNWTTYKNEVISVPDPGYFDAASHQQLGNIVRNQVGQEVSSFFGYEVIGLFQSETDVESSPEQSGAAPGRFKYKDVNADGVISEEDRTFLGSPNPDFTFGLNLSASYKNWDLSTNLYSSIGNEAVNAIKVQSNFFGTYTGAISRDLLNAWSPENPNSNIPVIESQNSFSTAGVFNSYFMEDASFLKMRSLILGYTFDNHSLQKIANFSKFKLYVQALNLLTVTNYSGLDPEIEGNTSNFGIDWSNYPNNEPAFLFGVNLSF